MKHTAERPYADPDAAARKLVELAASVAAVQDGRIYIERINGQFMIELKGSGSEFGAGLRYAIERGWLSKHESGTYVKLMPPGEDLLTRKLEPSLLLRPTSVENERGLKHPLNVCSHFHGNVLPYGGKVLCQVRKRPGGFDLGLLLSVEFQAFLVRVQTGVVPDVEVVPGHKPPSFEGEQWN